MSIDFVPNKSISFAELKTFNHRAVKVDTIYDDDSLILTDGKNYLWAYSTAEIEIYRTEKDGSESVSHNHYDGVMFKLCGANDHVRIFDAIENYFDIWMVSEYDEEYESVILSHLLNTDRDKKYKQIS